MGGSGMIYFRTGFSYSANCDCLVAYWRASWLEAHAMTRHVEQAPVFLHTIGSQYMMTKWYSHKFDLFLPIKYSWWSTASFRLCPGPSLCLFACLLCSVLSVYIWLTHLALTLNQLPQEAAEAISLPKDSGAVANTPGWNDIALEL